MLFKIGKIQKAHGLKGALKVYPYAKERASGLSQGVYFIDGKPFNLEWSGRIGSNLTVKFAEINDRNEADLFAGKEIEIDEKGLIPLNKDEYYIHEIIGCEVFDSEGVSLGKVEEVMHAPAGDVIDVDNGQRKLTILFKKVSLESVDTKMRIIRLRHPGKYYEI